MYEPEIHRLNGEVRLALNPENSAEAESCFDHAIEIARRHQAKALQLRATLSLARLWQRQGRCNEAHTKLDAIFSTFKEGLTTPDLIDAAAQLDALT